MRVVLLILAANLILVVMRRLRARRLRNAPLTPKETAAVMTALDKEYPPPPDFRGG